MGSRLITPRLVLDKVTPSAYSGHPSPAAPSSVSLTHLPRELDPEHGRPPSEASSPVDTDDCHDYLKTRKHVCHRCGKRFNRPSSLTIHYYTHTGERRQYNSFAPLHSLRIFFFDVLVPWVCLGFLFPYSLSVSLPGMFEGVQCLFKYETALQEPRFPS